MMLEGLPAGCSPTLAWGVLLHDVGKPPTFTPPAGPGGRIRFDGHVEVGTRMAEEICRRLRFSNEDTRADRGAGGKPSAVQGCAADEAVDAEAVRPAATVSKNIWSCTGWIAFRATAIWKLTISCGSSWRRRRRRRSGRRGW